MKKILSLLILILIFSVAGTLFSGFVVSTEAFIKVNAGNITGFFQDNWAIVALVISEVVAFLPNKWNGIIQSVLKIGDKIFNKKKSNP